MSNNLKRPRTASSPSPPAEKTLERLQRLHTEQQSRTAELERTVRELNHNLHHAEMMRQNTNEKLEEALRQSELRRLEVNDVRARLAVHELTIANSSGDGERLMQHCRNNAEQVVNILRTNPINITLNQANVSLQQLNQPQQLQQPPLNGNWQALIAAIVQHQLQQQAQQQQHQLMLEHLILNSLVNNQTQPAPAGLLMPVPQSARDAPIQQVAPVPDFPARQTQPARSGLPMPVQQPAETAPIQQVLPVTDIPDRDDPTDEEIRRYMRSLSNHECERVRRIGRRLLALSSRAQNESRQPLQAASTAPRAEQQTGSVSRVPQRAAGAGAPIRNAPVDAQKAPQRRDAPETSQTGPSTATRAAPVAPQRTPTQAAPATRAVPGATTRATSGALQNTPTAPQQAHPRATSFPQGPRSTSRAPQQAAPGIGSRAAPGTQAAPTTAPRTATKNAPEQVTLD